MKRFTVKTVELMKQEKLYASQGDRLFISGQCKVTKVIQVEKLRLIHQSLHSLRIQGFQFLTALPLVLPLHGPPAYPYLPARIPPGKKSEKEDEDPNQPIYVGDFPEVVRNEQA